MTYSFNRSFNSNADVTTAHDQRQSLETQESKMEI